MKVYVKAIFIFILLFTIFIPSEPYAESFGDGGGSVDEWLLNQDNETVDEDSEKTNEQPVEEVMEETEALAEDDEDTTAVGGVEDQNLFLLSLQMFLALGVVIFLIYGLLKFVNSRSKSFRSHSTIESIGGVGLGANRSIQLVRIGDKLFVVGVGETVQLLKEIEDEEEIEKIIEEHRPTEGIEQPVKKITNWVQDRYKGSSGNETHQSFHSLLDSKMKEVKDSQEKVHSSLKEKDRW
ncbi:flagellar biosynthetic protein FliO [Bacillus shivajii]|uniref:flagellar biosynthetic protein FliO n=1 Tax=Bacillus shivajii TaxID=1983719 RepID=UPI001CFA3F30|nr:flagellar biosynthetic protein FliO [Bacillus shivajii]UCZ51715.1 flagellar biosynthetic protein FliO [Bacillus shivajii]